MAPELYTKDTSKVEERSALKTVKMFLLKPGKRLRLNHRLVYGNAIAIHDKELPKSKVAEYLGLARQTIDDSVACLKKLEFLDEAGKPKPVPDDFFVLRRQGKNEADTWYNKYQYFSLYLPAPGKLSLDEAAVYSRFLNHEAGEWSERNIEHNCGIGHQRVKAIIKKLVVLGLIEKGPTSNQHFRVVVKKKPLDCDLFAKVEDKPKRRERKPVEPKRTDADKYRDYCIKLRIAPDTANRIAALCVQAKIGKALEELVAECQDEHDAEQYGNDFGPLLYMKVKQWKP